METSVCRTTVPVLASRLRKSGADPSTGFVLLTLGLGRRRRQQICRIERVKATGKSSGEDSGGEEALQAAIKNNEKLLGMQKELLRQIAERKELVSKIKSSLLDPEGSEEFGNDSLPNVGFTPASDGAEDDGNGALSTASVSVRSTADMKEYSQSPVSNDFVGSDRVGVKDLPSRERSLNRDSDTQFKNGSLSTIQSERSSVAAAQQTSSVLNSHKPKNASSQLLEPEEAPTLSNEKYEDLKESSSKKKTPEVVKSEKAPTLSNDKYEDLKESSSKTKTPEVVKSEKAPLEVQSTKDSKDSYTEKKLSDVPPFLLKLLTPSTNEDEKSEDLKESNAKEINNGTEEPVDADLKQPPLAGANVMNVILVASECAPWSKTGGLGDVAGALPKALARRGHRVMVVVPRYGNYAEAQDTGVQKRYKVDGCDMEVNYFHAYIDGVDFVFIESPIFRNIENNIYGGNRVDILKRMVLFCKAAVEVPWHVPCGGVCYGDGNLVFIANDWHTALLPVYLKAYYRDQGLMKYARSVLVINNIAYQGRGPMDDFSYVDLSPEYRDLFRLYDPVGGEHLNLFAAGLKMADRMVAVSHGYAWELKTPEGGWGLHGIINESDWKLHGIVNGIDTKEWSPQLDVHLKSDGYTNYSLYTFQTGKPQCKAALQKELGLPVRPDVPLIGFIGRLDPQKGVDLIAEAIPWMMGQDVQLVMLGTGRPELEQMLRQFECQHHDKVRGWVGFSVKTAHRITASADILLMPSRFEPCGLNQLYAMNYGTVPVVHAVGGLRDTVQPFDPYNETGLGWTFSRAEANQLIHALGNCLLTYRQYKKSWEGLMKRGMMQDLSWDRAAQNYEEVLVAAKYQW